MGEFRGRSMKISVLVSTYNQPKHLRRVLVGYMCQTDRNFEVLVADDGSRDETRLLVEEMAKASPVPIRHFWHEDKGHRKYRIHNIAIREAAGDYLIFTDGDCIPRDDVVAVLRANIAPGEYIVGSCNRLPARTSEAIGEEDIRSGRIFGMGWLMRRGYAPAAGFLRIAVPRGVGRLLDRRGSGDAGWGRCPGYLSGCWRKDALAIGGFDERITYGGGDREFGTRLCNYGVRSRRVKHSTYVLHLDHGRPYRDEALIRKHKEMLRETETTGRIRAGHLDAQEGGGAI